MLSLVKLRSIQLSALIGNRNGCELAKKKN